MKEKFTIKDVRERDFRRADLPNIKHNEPLKKKKKKNLCKITKVIKFKLAFS